MTAAPRHPQVVNRTGVFVHHRLYTILYPIPICTPELRFCSPVYFLLYTCCTTWCTSQWCAYPSALVNPCKLSEMNEPWIDPRTKMKNGLTQVRWHETRVRCSVHVILSPSHPSSAQVELIPTGEITCRLPKSKYRYSMKSALPTAWTYGTKHLITNSFLMMP